MENKKFTSFPEQSEEFSRFSDEAFTHMNDEDLERLYDDHVDKLGAHEIAAHGIAREMERRNGKKQQ